MASAPVQATRMQQICNDACDSVLAKASSYDHASTAAWNSEIISKILSSVTSESTPAGQANKYKWVVNSTIIQHLSDPRPAGDESAAEAKSVGRRGMHSASGAFWNNEKDGMWSHKYEAGEGKGMDIVISIVWVAV